ncbi:Uncharacterised protein [Vibrio cholerae]|nr:Uncharacterised protein [Vibrio cholerae]
MSSKQGSLAASARACLTCASATMASTVCSIALSGQFCDKYWLGVIWVKS